ncbi:thymidine kinase [Rhizosphaericola mali]|uniref:Thymidine kinase n=1 Tax=Rhizosphaericola mali TaxID=2545455 RepID=A0A5P2FUT0_9BACT|nr:thymidine kinase [Rhizosphaericola mali]QES87214.1 thymidine kinase [Rhizosphaericola mali]
MFIEPEITGVNRGWIEVICGSMFSGKTEELIRRLKRVKIANRNVELFKPEIDTRYAINDIVSHNSSAMAGTPVNNSQNILLLAQDADVIGIDEAQFFDAEIVHVCETLANRGMRVIVAGLDMDYLGKPFGPMPQLLAVADYITKLHAICMKCGNIASLSYRKIANAEQLLLGESDKYEPRCRKCYAEGMEEQKKLLSNK